MTFNCYKFKFFRNSALLRIFGRLIYLTFALDFFVIISSAIGIELGQSQWNTKAP